MPYYKVVSQDLTSFVAKNEDLCIQYRVGEWVKPKVKHTDIMVFDTLEAADSFRSSETKRIFECAVQNPRKKGAFINWRLIRNGNGIPYSLQRLINLKKKKKSYKSLIDEDVINHTVFCSSIKLTREIEEFRSKIYYKVVSSDLTSAIGIARDAGLEAKYFPGYTTYPKFNWAPLFVFNSLDDAKLFKEREGNSGLRIFECSIGKSDIEWKRVSTYTLKRSAENNGALYACEDLGTPKGTVFADWVRLMKEVI